MAELVLGSTPAGTPGVVDGGARDQRPRQLAAIPSSALAQLTTTRARASEFWGCPTPLRPNDHPDLKMANASCYAPCIGYAPQAAQAEGSLMAIRSPSVRPKFVLKGSTRLRRINSA